ncbi:MAG: metalloregulator ArsR/SmtB family transcription factor [Pseudomonadota bacterium]
MSTNEKRTIDSRMQARLDARARIVKAMGHPTRLFILEELGKGDRCVNELTEMIGADVSTVSKHLSLLKTAGIVQDRKKGSQVYYGLRVPCILKFFDCIEAVLEANARAHAELVSPRCPV